MIKKAQVDLEELLDNDKEISAPQPSPPVAFYDFYKPSNASGREAAVFHPVGPSLTRQEFAEECDINVLMKRYENQDIGSIMRRSQEPVYYDLTEAPSDLMGYMQLMQDAQNAFMTLSAQVRREFDNDPVRFVDFAGDPANLDQMRSWGLAPPAPQAPSVPPSSEPTTPPVASPTGGKPAQ